MRLSTQHIQYFLISEGLASLARNAQGQYVFVPVRNAETKNILDMKVNNNMSIIFTISLSESR